jgi:hypothetical protein
MDLRSEELFKVKLDVRNFEFNSKTYLSQKGKIFYSERAKIGNNVQNGTR